MSTQEAKHTSGPWKDGPVFQKEGRAIFITDEREPGKWQRRLDDKQGVFSVADARLIAAAPELLEALRMLVDCAVYGDVIQEADAWKDARAAIAKATGGAA